MATEQSITRRTWLAGAAAAGVAASGVQQWGAPAMAAENSELRIIDPHVHVWKSDPKYPWSPDLKDPPAQDALPGTLLELMHAHGVEKTVIVHVIYYRWDCRYAAAAVQAHGDKFRGVCRVDPQSPQAVADLEH